MGSAQELPKLTFQNIDIWPVARGGNNVRCVLEDKYGFIWIGTTMGAYRWDGQDLHAYVQGANPNMINENSITLIYQDLEEDIWFGTAEGGLNKYIPELDEFERFNPPDGKLGHISRIVEDERTHFWIAAQHGLVHYDLNKRTYRIYTPQEIPKKEAGFGFRGLARDEVNSNILWVAGSDGFYKFDTRTHEFEYISMPYSYEGYPYFPFRDLQIITDGLVVGGSWGGGVLCYDIARGKWHSSVPQNSLDGRWYTTVLSVLPIDSNRMWVAGGAGFGIFQRDIDSYSFYKWDHQDPSTIDSSFHYTGLLKTSQNNVVVTRVKGISISSNLDPQAIELKFKPIIVELRIDGRPMSTDSAMHLVKKLHLTGENKDVSITLSSPGNYSKGLVYSYMLEGYDNDWVMMKEGRTIRYTNLPGGKYHFRYRASLDGKNWLEGNVLSIDRAVHFWQKAWFILASIISLVTILIVIYRLKVGSVRREAALKSEFDRKLAEVELQALRAQMNPHFMFNSLNSIKHYILTHEPLKASEYLTNFATLIRLILHNSTEKFIPLSKEMEALLLYVDLEQLRFKDKFNFRCNVSEEVNTDLVMVPPLILQPYVENAIWHGLLHRAEPGCLEIDISRSNGTVQCTIQDNGIGRRAAGLKKSKSATKFKSMGMGITESRIALRNRISRLGISVEIVDLVNSNSEAMGTKVIIHVPDALHDQHE